MQDQYENVILNMYVRPAQPVVSYLTPLTGCASCRLLLACASMMMQPLIVDLLQIKWNCPFEPC